MTSNRHRFAVAALGLALLYGPWLAAAAGARSDPVASENRALAERPTWHGLATLQEITTYTADRFPLRDNALAANLRLGDVAGAKGGRGLVVKGHDGWLYLNEDFIRACRPKRPTAATIAALQRLDDIITASGRRLVVAIIPDKSTFQTEFLPGSYPFETCSVEAKRDRFERLRDAGLSEFVDMTPILEADQRATGQPAYQKTDTHWTDRSSALFVKTLAEKLDPALADATRLSGGAHTRRQGDIALLNGDRDPETDVAYEIVRDGVTVDVRAQPLAPKGAFDIRHITARSAGPARVFEPKTLWIGDSFSDRALHQYSQYFADLVETPDLTRAATIGDAATGKNLYDAVARRVVRGIVDSDVVVLQAVERFFFGTTQGSLLNRRFLDRLERSLRSPGAIAP